MPCHRPATSRECRLECRMQTYLLKFGIRGNSCKPYEHRLSCQAMWSLIELYFPIVSPPDYRACNGTNRWFFLWVFLVHKSIHSCELVWCFRPLCRWIDSSFVSCLSLVVLVGPWTFLGDLGSYPMPWEIFAPLVALQQRVGTDFLFRSSHVRLRIGGEVSVLPFVFYF